MAFPIGESQTISSPFIVAYMTEAIDPQPTDKVWRSARAAATRRPCSVALVARSLYDRDRRPLGRKAEKTLNRLHYKNVHVKVGDGYLGWPEHAPFDKIIVTCSPENIPTALFQQLKDGGLMDIPCGERFQQTLYLMKKARASWCQRHCRRRCLCR